MGICRNCGSEGAETAKFCRSCGSPLQPSMDEPAIVEPPSAGVAVSGQTGTGKRARVIIIAAAALIVLAGLLFGAYRFGAYYISEDRLIDRFEQALEDKDTAKLAELLTTDDEELVIDKDSIMSFIDYLSEESDAADDLVTGLRKQAFAGSDEDDDEESRTLIQLEADGKYLYLFDRHRLKVLPVYMTLATNYKGVSLQMNGKELAVTDKAEYEETFGPLVPGLYKLKASMKNDFVDLSQEQSVMVIDAWDDYEVDLSLEGEEITVYTDMGDDNGLKGKLFLNGQDTGIDPFETPEFGPVTTDGSMKLAVEAEFPWGTQRTAEVPVDSRGIEVSLGRAGDDAFKERIIGTVQSFLHQDLAASTTGDMTKLTLATDEMRSQIQSGIDNVRSNNLSYRTTLNAMSFDIDSFYVYREDGNWKLTLLAVLELTRDYNYGNGWTGANPDAEGRAFTLRYDEPSSAWLVEEYISFFDGVDMSDNMREVKEQKPVTYTTAWKPSAAVVDLPSMQAFMGNYVSQSVMAINSRDFSEVSHLLDPAGPAYEESENYIAYLKSKGITEELLDIQVTGFKQLDENSYEVSTTESYNIAYSDRTVAEKSYVSKYKVVSVNGELRLHKLISTQDTTSA